jgi:hypothetical protein
MVVNGRRLGVDYGTSNTVAALTWPDGVVKPLLFDGSPLLPSAVWVGSARPLVGRDALHAARSSPASFEPNPKRRIDDGSVLLGGVGVAVADLIAAVLARVLDEARRVAGGPPAATTLTYPAAWGLPRRAVLIAAAEAAGLGTVELVAEPVAAARYFVEMTDARVPVGGCAVVYDFGAGTFDASVVRRTSAGFEVLAAEGLADVGGLDIDAAIVAYLGETRGGRDSAQWRALVEPATEEQRRAARQMWDDVRTAKEMLSRTTSALIHLPLGTGDEVPLGREQLEQLARPIIDRTVAATRNAVRDSGIATSAIGGLFLVGGSSRMPLVATLLHRGLGVVPTIIDQPELVVAEGSLRDTAADQATATGSAPPIPPGQPEPADPLPYVRQPWSGGGQPDYPRPARPYVDQPPPEWSRPAQRLQGTPSAGRRRSRWLSAAWTIAAVLVLALLGTVVAAANGWLPVHLGVVASGSTGTATPPVTVTSSSATVTPTVIEASTATASPSLSSTSAAATSNPPDPRQIAASQIAACEARHGLSRQQQKITLTGKAFGFASCAWPPASYADGDGYTEIRVTSVGTGASEASGASSVDRITGPCSTFYLSYDEHLMGGLTDHYSFRAQPQSVHWTGGQPYVDDGKVFDGELLAARVQAPARDETQVLRTEGGELVKADCQPAT